MNRTALLTITLLSSLAAPFVVQAMTPAREAQPAIAAPAPIVQAVAGASAAPSCVYAGYGESAARPCEARAAAK
jgi:hypothetical protein